MIPQNIGGKFKDNHSKERKQLIEKLKIARELLIQVSESEKVFVKK